MVGEFTKTKGRNEFLLLINDRFREITKTVPMKGFATAEVTVHFINAFLFNCGLPEELTAYNGGCSTSKFFIDVCKIM